MSGATRHLVRWSKALLACTVLVTAAPVQAAVAVASTAQLAVPQGAPPKPRLAETLRRCVRATPHPVSPPRECRRQIDSQRPLQPARARTALFILHRALRR